MSEKTVDVEQEIMAALQEVAPEAEPDKLQAGVNLRDQIDMDSVDFLNFVTALERRLDVKIPEQDYPKLSSLDGCRRYMDGS